MEAKSGSQIYSHVAAESAAGGRPDPRPEGRRCDQHFAHGNKRIAPSVEKVLRSAIANAENRYNDVDVDKLFVTECYVNEGPRMKRVRPAPMGRAYRYQRRMAHIMVKVGDESRRRESRSK